MVRTFKLVLLAGLIAVVGCEQKVADPTAKKVTSQDVRRDVGQAAKN